MRTRERVEQEMAGLTPEQLGFRAGAGRWTIAEVMEHVATVEEFFLRQRLPALPAAPPPPPDHPRAELDERIRAEAPQRLQRFETPEVFQPKGQMSAAEALERFRAAREALVKFARQPGCDLRAHCMPHRILTGPGTPGVLDGCQWLLAIAAHSLRHAEQMAEVKRQGGYPKASAIGSGAQAN